MRRWLIFLAFLLGTLWTAVVRTEGTLPDYPAVVSGKTLNFPSDHGAHPDFRTEWWYVTGWIKTKAGEPLGFQITFFRSRPALDESNPSRFAPKQLLFAHAALSDPARGRLMHDQRAVRTGFGVADAAVDDTEVHIGTWSLQRDAAGIYHGRVQANEFSLDLALEPSQPVLLQGESGYSRKGPRSAQASYYYSQPQLRVSGSIVRQGNQEVVSGSAWLDHEWSSAVLAQEAVGWDWTGINLDDGGSFMAFRIRDKSGEKFWAGGTLRRADGSHESLSASQVQFLPQRHWRSPRTGTLYPVAMQVQAADLTLELAPLMDDQELDSQATTGAVYWEGAVTAKRDGQKIGQGYLELTGYFQKLDF
ncbi:carotenoid 1,2-hydratase [Candidimonas sp. SYP-B2681]|uniref:lipocalin-like domain-containing protein n=1 Tax=Candidimonas sp. SYP-B2681 TaxID=2497686 RepID=UPI000F85C296|nr:carotenoid 1,2-hydratase [Candidimonas sp. SYP-B2681]RTZ48130.1 carotenoid 1,2-hydratase [Candidimonas sp. SYP-B2681]